MASQEILREAAKSRLPLSTTRKSAALFYQMPGRRLAGRRASGGSSTTPSTTCRRAAHRLRLRLPAAAAPASTSRDTPDRLLRRTRPTGRALLVGLLNTLIVAVVGIITATIIGFIVGIGRLSRQLADPEDLHGLCRDLPQHPAAAGHLLLVSRRALRAAGAARQHPPAASAPTSTTAASTSRGRSGARAPG